MSAQGDVQVFRLETIWYQLDLIVRFMWVVGLAVPSTVLLPLPVSQLFTKRFRREETLKRLHFMVLWARKTLKWVLGARLMVHGREHLPKSTKGYMYVSNHQSYVDILVLMSALDTVAFLSKSLVKKIPLIGRSAYCGGTVFFARRDAEDRMRALEETLKMCKESTAVVVFPEGRRSSDGNLRDKIHPRAIVECFRRNLKVIPVGLDGSFQIVAPTMNRVVTGLPVSVHIDAPLEPRDYPDEEAFVQAVWGTVRRLHEAAKRDVMADRGRS